MKLYPLKFSPLYYYRIWGGEKLKTVLNKNYDEDSIGESWEISDVEGSETQVSSGELKGWSLKDLIKQFKGDFVGKNVFETFGNEFPLLIKFIDAKIPLSIQVHPDDFLAKKRHNSFGKNEMWYIMETEENAELIVGFNQSINKEEYTSHLNNSTLSKILNVEKVKKGDAFYIPTGRVHAIGGGVLLAEIQQTSNVTYRIFDYDRVDLKTGEKRELHTDLAIDAIDFDACTNYKTEYLNKINFPNKLIHSPYFKTNIVEISSKMELDYTNLDSFVIYICTEGRLEIEYDDNLYKVNKGETILLPAIINHVKINSTYAVFIEIFLA